MAVLDASLLTSAAAVLFPGAHGLGLPVPHL
jgi:hypothetical protein